MKLSPAGRLAIRGILVLVEDYPQAPITLSTISKRRNLPKQYLAKIFGTLVRVGLITAIRGKHGGYRLARAPRDISVLEVIEAIEGPLALNLCQNNPPQCEEVNCPLRPVWTEMQNFIRDKLGSITLQDYLHAAGVRPPQDG